MTSANRTVPLERDAEEVCEQSALYPRIYQLPPEQGRRRLEEAQSTPVYKYPADIKISRIHTGKWGTIPVYLVSPTEIREMLGERKVCNVIFYLHGAGWVFGSFHTHEKLVRELAARTGSLVVFPEYSRAPEARYPAAMEQCYFLLSHLWSWLERLYPDIRRETLTVAGDSAGGNMAIAMVFLQKMRSGPDIQKLLLYYPVTDACFDTPSYCRFAEGYYLYRDGMKWFWQQYAPSSFERNQITASPLRADVEYLKHFPDTMIINGQADVLRSEGEAFGEKLRCAGVKVAALRVQGTIHDFVMLNALDQTEACRTAMDASVGWIVRKNQERTETIV